MFAGVFVSTNISVNGYADEAVHNTLWANKPNVISPETTSLITRSGLPIAPTAIRTQSSSDKLFAIRRITGLTAEEIASLLGSTPRSFFNWLNGEPMKPANELRLAELFGTLLVVNEDDPIRFRQRLFTSNEKGKTPFKLITLELYDEALHLLARPLKLVPKDNVFAKKNLIDPLTLMTRAEDSNKSISASNNPKVRRTYRLKT